MRPRDLLRLLLQTLVFAGLFVLPGCEAPVQTVSSTEPSSQRYGADLPGGGRITLWVTRQPSADGQPAVGVQLDDPLERALLNGGSQAQTNDSLHVVFQLEDGGSNILKAQVKTEESLRATYTRQGAPAAMEIALLPEKDDPVFIPRTIGKKTEPAKEAEAAEGDGHEEMGIAELGQEISLDVFAITRADGSKHPLDSVLERFICGEAVTYDRFIAGMKDGPFSYELGTTINHRGADRICLSVFVHEQRPGAAHGMFGTRTLNYDPARNTVIGLWDVIDRRKRGALIAACAKAFYAQHPDKNKREFPFKLTENVALVREGITFIYPPYEMGSFAEGEVSFFMPFSTLLPMMLPGTGFAGSTRSPS